MKYLAIDTSGGYLSVAACNGKEVKTFYADDCAMKHSIVLMDKIDEAFAAADLLPAECDFFAAVVGPGSFTGIRIGISTIKGLCFACGKPALAVTSFDVLAYAEKNVPLLALVDAGHGAYYACRYNGEKKSDPPAYMTGEETREEVAGGFAPVAVKELFPGCAAVSPMEGLVAAVNAKSGGTISADGLSALYLRKSSAEEKRG